MEEKLEKQSEAWTVTIKVVTACCFPWLLSCCGIKGGQEVQAWKEKVTLCSVIGAIMIAVAYFTVGMRFNLCPDPLILRNEDRVIIHGSTYSFNDTRTLLGALDPPILVTLDWISQDLTNLFDFSYGSCQPFIANQTTFCTILNRFPQSPPLTSSCLSPSILAPLTQTMKVTLDWSDIKDTSPPNILVVYNNGVLNLTSDYSSSYVNVPPLNRIIPFTDITLGVSSSSSISFVKCLSGRNTVAYVGSNSTGCAVFSGLTAVALTVVLGVILTRFIMALIFHWIVAPKLSIVPINDMDRYPKLRADEVGFLQVKNGRENFFSSRDERDQGPLYKQAWARGEARPEDLHTICLVTCYSEDEVAIKSTLDSIAGTSYPDQRKLLVVICDGLIYGAGNSQSTPNIVVSLIKACPGTVATPMSYLAIADGKKQHNMAKVYAGEYVYRQKPVPIIVVVKCGTPEERENENTRLKAGNRGKRDSQCLLFHFLSRVTFNDRMTALDFDLFWKIQKITGGVTADLYQLLMMVDADTVVDSLSLRHMVQAMVNDPNVMGLCGETRIANKTQSWVTRIQVYEYFTNHNLGKSFESLFGGVTCLPGCFCMYRLKAAQNDDHFIPLLVNPDVVECYSENVVDTLHKKNLFLLGEDRFLSTLMLGTFPKRKMIFVPQAICRTTVPHTYKMLQSQRRRWINSTIHNLLELVLLPTLCGTFCFSMQFLIALELFGTVSLPVAVILTYYLIFSSITTGSASLVPLVMLIMTLVLPGLLVLVTTRKPVYVLWMFVYLAAIPVWNFALPIYAFWHFDDFSWGDTRKIEGESKQSDHSTRNGKYEIGSVQLKKWEEWESIRRRLDMPDLPKIPLDRDSTVEVLPLNGFEQAMGREWEERYGKDVQKPLKIISIKPITIANEHLDVSMEERRPSLVGSLQAKAGNTINQYWKSLYNEQFDSIDYSIDMQSKTSNVAIEKPPALPERKLKVIALPMLQLPDADPFLVFKEQKFDTSIESFDTFTTAKPTKFDTFEDSFATAQSYGISSVSSSVQGSRPSPFEEDFELEIGLDAKTSTTTKSFMERMRRVKKGL